MDYAIGEFIYMLPSDMNLQIGKVRNYNNKILISSPSFKIGTNVKVNIDGEQVKLKDKPDVKSKEIDNRRLVVKTEPDVIELDKRRLNVKPKVITKPNIEPNKERRQDVKPDVKFDRESKPDTNEITTEPSLDRRSMELNNYEEEKVALILETTAVFTVLWMFK